MSSFRLVGLPAEPFAPLFALADDALAAHGARRVVADAPVGYPCRVSLVDADVGDTLLLLPFEHLATTSPYRSGGAIFVREHAVAATPAPGEIPDVVARRLISVRAYDGADLMVDAAVCEGADLRPLIERLLADARVAFLHLHNARRGCFACRVERCAPAAQAGLR